MKAIPELKSNTLIERINELQKISAHRYIDPTQVSGVSRDWRLIGREIRDLFRVDACVAWELTGAWKGLTGDFEGTEEAFRASAALGDNWSNRCNWTVNRLNLGMFSAAQEMYSSVGSPETGHFSEMLEDGYKAGAIAQAAHYIERARQMNIDWDKKLVHEIEAAHTMLKASGISDERVARQLDVAGSILRKHGIRPHVSPRVTASAGFFEGVTYSLAVPVSAEEAFEMNVELAMCEDEAGIEKCVEFDVVFEAAFA
ncbi:hypothetical protein [Caballeronia sp. HLA56]